MYIKVHDGFYVFIGDIPGFGAFYAVFAIHMLGYLNFVIRFNIGLEG